MPAHPHLIQLVLSIVLAAPCAAFAQPSYTVTVLGGAGSSAAGINSSGQVVGQFLGAGALQHAVLYSGGSAIDLGSLGGGNGYASAINDAGQIAGSSTTAAGSWHGFLYAGGAMSDLGTLGGSFSYATGINNAGIIVGEASVGGRSRLPYAFAYADGVMRTLGALPGGFGSRAFGIANSGQIVGHAYEGPFTRPDYPYHAALFSNGSVTNISQISEGGSTATAMNDLGHVAGSTVTETLHDTHAFLYVDGVMTDLGTLGAEESYAKDINNLGQVVGGSDVWVSEDSSVQHGFLYTGEGALQDLNALIDGTSGWTIIDASGINDLQQISATGCRNGECFALRLDLMSAVPEPAGYGMLLVGLLGLALQSARARCMRISSEAYGRIVSGISINFMSVSGDCQLWFNTHRYIITSIK